MCVPFTGTVEGFPEILDPSQLIKPSVRPLLHPLHWPIVLSHIQCMPILFAASPALDQCTFGSTSLLLPVVSSHECI